MITLNRKSWHYELVERYLDGNHRENLCPYMRQVMLSILLCIFVGTLAFIALVPVVHTLVWLTFITLNGYIEPEKIALLFPFLAILFTVICLIYFGTSYVSNKVEKMPSDSLVKHYIQATHNKLCPSITFKSK